LRLRLPLLRAAIGRRRRSRHRLVPLRARAVLVSPPRTERADGVSGVTSRRHAPPYASGRPRAPRRPRRHGAARRTVRVTTIVIEPARDFVLIRDLILDYAAALRVDLSFQNFDDELEHLDEWYELILVSRVDGEAAGCAALRKLERRICEMKRLFVRP